MVYASTKQGFLASMGSEMGIEVAKKVSEMNRERWAFATITNTLSSARGLESFRDHCIDFGRGVSAKAGAEAGLFETQEAREKVIIKSIPA